MAFVIWCIVYAISNAPNIWNHTGNDTAWLITGAIALLLTIRSI